MEKAMEAVGNMSKSSVGSKCLLRSSADLVMDPDDSPWRDNSESLRDTEWSKISSEFLNVRILGTSLISLCSKTTSRPVTATASPLAKNPPSKRDSTRVLHKLGHRLVVA